jgi:LmbE family N-acetylglucosaminyl deacetylase
VTRALAVVAHFDDAVIWAGGAILRTRALGWDWAIVCTCAAERTRREYFLESCDALGARGIALEFVDHPDGGPFTRNDRSALSRAVREALGAAPIDWVLTHRIDRHGEYGPHPNHTEAGRVVSELAKDGALLPGGVAHFAYRRIYGLAGLSTVADAEASHYLQLDYDDLAWKAEWCARARDVELADPSLGGTSWLEKLAWPCPNPEAFQGPDLRLPEPFTRR